MLLATVIQREGTLLVHCQMKLADSQIVKGHKRFFWLDVILKEGAKHQEVPQKAENMGQNSAKDEKTEKGQKTGGAVKLSLD